MIRLRGLLITLLFNGLLPNTGICQGRPVAGSARADGAAQITFADGKTTTIPKEPGQVGINEAQIASDGTVGWLVEYVVDGVPYPIAEKLIVWRAGTVIRRLSSEQVFYSWTVYASGQQVAYHDGPLHVESESHCELHDAESGRLIAHWDGDLESKSNRPAWTQGLSH
jgi:hypothetical protein